MQGPILPPLMAGKPIMQSPPRPQPVPQQDQPDKFLKMLEGPVVTVIVGSGPSTASYNLPVALLSFHSHFFRKEVLRLESIRARIGGNKKRKVSREDSDTVVEVKKENDESAIEDVAGHKMDVGEIVIRLSDAEPIIFGLFLKYMYMGFYPVTVDAPVGGGHALPQASTT
ncbi:hypothetical protein N0V94_008253, partial [Neodidymelliopsis sp. IMI 364377]